MENRTEIWIEVLNERAPVETSTAPPPCVKGGPFPRPRAEYAAHHHGILERAWAEPVTSATGQAVASYDWVELYRLAPN